MSFIFGVFSSLVTAIVGAIMTLVIRFGGWIFIGLLVVGVILRIYITDFFDQRRIDRDYKRLEKELREKK